MAGPPRTRYRYDVFLSHSSADKLVVREWFDEWLIWPGADREAGWVRS